MKKILLLNIIAAWFFTVTIKAQTYVGGAITSNTIWDLAGSPYIVQSNVALMSGTLTIEPGVVVKFDSAKSIQIFGTLRAVGTQNLPITFTSNSSTPNPGDWGYILFNDASTDYNFSNGTGCIMKYCVVEYGGGATTTWNGTVRMNNACPYINNCTIQHNSMPGIKAWNLSSTLHIDSSAIQYNNVDTGAVYARNGTISMNGCNISNNNTSLLTTNDYSVAGIFTIDVAMRIKHCTLNSNNSRAIGGCQSNYYNIQTDSIISNTIINNFKDGIYYLGIGSTASGRTFFILNNIITDNSGNGICCDYPAPSYYDTYIITGNTISNNTGNGIYYSILTSCQNTYNITNNTITDNTGNGIYYVYYNNTSSDIWTITNNTIINNTGNGIHYNYAGYNCSSHTYTITNNIINKNYGSGMYFKFPNSPYYCDNNNLNLQKNKVINNSNTQGGGIFIQSSDDYRIALIMKQNIIAGNTASGQGAGVYLNFRDTSNVITYNTIINNIGSTSSGIYYKGTGKMYADKNTIVFNKATGSDSLRMVYLQKAQSFNHNNIYYKTCGFPIDLWYDDFNGNMLDANNCFWRKTTSAEIDSVVWDYFDDQNIAIVDYFNFETLPDTAAPVTPVENIVKTNLGGGNIQLSWSPNSETDLAGYKVYWGVPTGYSFPNVVDVFNVTSYLLSGVNVSDSITVTAYDIQADGTDDQVEGHESWFSGTGGYGVFFPVITQVGNTLYCNPAFSSYQWYLNGVLIPGAIQQQYTPAVSGNYSVSVIDANGCTATSVKFNFVIVGIEQTDENYTLVVYPNPSNGIFNLEIPVTGLTQIKVMNVLGEIVYKSRITNNKSQLDLSGQPKGIYILKLISNNEKIETEKIVVQ